MSIQVAVGLVSVKRFDHEGLHQLQYPTQQEGHELEPWIVYIFSAKRHT